MIYIKFVDALKQASLFLNRIQLRVFNSYKLRLLKNLVIKLAVLKIEEYHFIKLQQVITLYSYKTIDIMKNLLIFIICFNIQSFGFAQILTDIDEVTPLNENLVAIKKGNQWGFLNEEGLLVIDFRDDFVLDKAKTNSYPFFKDGRCLIRKLINDKYLYGYIDTKGNEVITPQYLNASNFNNGYAIIIKISKEVIGYNQVFRKDLTIFKLDEFIIDVNGEEVKYLESSRNYIPSKGISKSPPNFHSKFIAPHLVAVIKKDGKWDIYKY